MWPLVATKCRQLQRHAVGLQLGRTVPRAAVDSIPAQRHAVRCGVWLQTIHDLSIIWQCCRTQKHFHGLPGHSVNKYGRSDLYLVPTVSFQRTPSSPRPLSTPVSNCNPDGTSLHLTFRPLMSFKVDVPHR
jgi:hypothetical protein